MYFLLFICVIAAMSLYTALYKKPFCPAIQSKPIYSDLRSNLDFKLIKSSLKFR